MAAAVADDVEPKMASTLLSTKVRAFLAAVVASVPSSSTV